MGQNKDLDNILLQQANSLNVAGARAALREGADPAARDSAGRTALHMVLAKRDYSTSYNDHGKEIAAMLLNRGLDPNVRDDAGATALHGVAQLDGYTCRARIDDMVSFGADIEARDNKGRTPLFMTLENSRPDALQFFLSAGAKVNAADNEGITPLHVAAARTESEHIKHLLGAGADLNAKTKDGRTAWDFAREAGKDYQSQWLKAEAGKRRAETEKKQAEARAKREQDAPRDPWTLLSSDRVAYSKAEPAIGYKLTEIFNFNARTYTHIAHNMNTKGEAVTVKTFDEFSDRTPLEKAHAELERLGGQADRAVINGPLVEKPRPAGLKALKPST